jgi:hypothetical protein
MTTNNPAPGNGEVLTCDRRQHPHDNLMTAISVLQLKSLASDSLCDGDSTWGAMFMPDASLDHVIRLLIDVLPYVEKLVISKAKGDAL